MDIQYINTFARYQIKLTKRSWVFRIFAFLIVVITCGWVLIGHSHLTQSYINIWEQSVLPSFIALRINMIYNVAQCVLIVFLAGGFLTKEKKLDTTEVFFVRPVSNTDYIMGKTLGIIRLFLGLNILLLLFGMFVQIVINKYPFSITPYLFYFTTISIPSIVFMLGLTYSILLLVKSQPIMMILVLGIVGISEGIIKDSYWGIFDFLGIHQGLIFSDITGLASTGFLLMRLSYFLVGLGLIYLSITLFKRLPEKSYSRKIVGSFAFVFLLSGVIAGFMFTGKALKNNLQRETYLTELNKVNSIPAIDILRNDIIIHPSKNNLAGESRIAFRCDTSCRQIKLYLNPSLAIDELSINRTAIKSYNHKNLSLVIDYPIEKDSIYNMELHYSGNVNEAVAYLDTDETILKKSEVYKSWNLGRRATYFSKDYILLTPEVMWYPYSTPPTNPTSKYELTNDYALFSLTVDTIGFKGTPISYGKKEAVANGYRFSSDIAVPCISCVMGNYDMKQVKIDSIELNLYYYKGHDFFASAFDQLNDTLVPLIKERMDYLAIQANHAYPYHELNLVEVPIHFITIQREWKGHPENITPGMVLYREYGCTHNVDLERSKRMFTRRDQEMSEEELQCNVFTALLSTTFCMKEMWNSKSLLYLSPMYTDFNYAVKSKTYPIIDCIFKKMKTLSSPNFTPFFKALGDNDKANIYLSHHSLKDAYQDRSLNMNELNGIMDVKTRNLKYTLISNIGIDNYFKLMRELEQKYSMSEVELDTIVDSIKETYSYDLSPFIEHWYNDREIPTFIYKNVTAARVTSEDKEMFRLSFDVYNKSNVEGVLEAEVAQQNKSFGGRGRGGFGGRSGGGPRNNWFMGNSTDERTQLENKELISIPANCGYRIVRIYEDQPFMLTLNSAIVNNIPSSKRFSLHRIKAESVDSIERIETLSLDEFNNMNNEIIIDDNSTSFQIVDNSGKKLRFKTFVNNLIHKEENKYPYRALNPWNMPREWEEVINPDFYGESINSAHCKLPGSGLSKASWKTTIKEGGEYELYAWVQPVEMWGGNMGPGDERRRNKSEESIEQYYELNYANSNEQLTLTKEGKNDEWCYLGHFYFEDNTDVELLLSDKCKNKLVIADAIKFVKINR